MADVYEELGQSDRAVEILRGLIAEGGEEGDFARVQLARSMFDAGREDEARAELAEFKATCRTTGGAWLPAGELFEARDELTEGASWFTLAVSLFTDDDRAALDESTGWMSRPGMMVRARRRIRAADGLKSDDIDQMVLAEEEIRSWQGWNKARVDETIEKLTQPSPAELKMLFWPRSQFELARSRWPGTIDGAIDQAGYYRNLEVQLRNASTKGTARVSIVPCSVDDLAAHFDRTGDDPWNSASRRDFLEARHAEGHYLNWPPARNLPCWCESGVKYKKCCGAPVADADQGAAPFEPGDQTNGIMAALAELGRLKRT